MTKTIFEIKANEDEDLGDQLDALLDGALDDIAKPAELRREAAPSAVLGMADNRIVTIEIYYDGLDEGIIARILKSITKLMAGKGTIIVKPQK